MHDERDALDRDGDGVASLRAYRLARPEAVPLVFRHRLVAETCRLHVLRDELLDAGLAADRRLARRVHDQEAGEVDVDAGCGVYAGVSLRHEDGLDAVGGQRGSNSGILCAVRRGPGSVVCLLHEVADVHRANRGLVHRTSRLDVRDVVQDLLDALLDGLLLGLLARCVSLLRRRLLCCGRGLRLFFPLIVGPPL